jgi:hypothetical protein
MTADPQPRCAEKQQQRNRAGDGEEAAAEHHAVS